MMCAAHYYSDSSGFLFFNHLMPFVVNFTNFCRRFKYHFPSQFDSLLVEEAASSMLKYEKQELFQFLERQVGPATVVILQDQLLKYSFASTTLAIL